MKPLHERRPLTADERRLVDETLRRWDARRAALAPDWKELGVPGLGLTAIAAVLGLFDLGFAPFLGVGGLAMLLLAAFVAWKARSFELGPSPHAEASMADVYTLHATRLVAAIDDRGDGQTWLLYEVAPECWYLLVDERLPYVPSLPKRAAHATVRWAVTDTGLPLGFVGEGEVIPLRGLRHDTDKGIERAVAAGYLWSPPSDAETFRPDELPGWVTDWDASP